MRQLLINGHLISDGSAPWVIAELGHNHGGSHAVCRDMIEAAAQAGADAVKLQKRQNRTLYTREYFDRPYTSENAFGPTYGLHREALEIPDQHWAKLDLFAHQHGLVFFATAFDHASADFLAERTSCAAFKVASGDLTNTPLLKHIAQYQRPMIVSTGAADESDVDRAVQAITATNTQLALLQCTAIYPAPAAVLNLRCITTYRERYPELVIGFSSHYSGISDVVAAYVLGARIFEKHFTLDRTEKGTDHAYSLEPAGFAKMVSYLRRTRVMLGSERKIIQDDERPALAKMGKSLVAARDLPAGHVLKAEDIAIKSPGGGFPPYMAESLVGATLPRGISGDKPFREAE